MFPCYAASMINYSAIAHDHNIFFNHFLFAEAKKLDTTPLVQHRGLLAQWYRSMAWTQQFDKCFETLFTFLGSSGTCLGGLWRSPGTGFPNVLNFFCGWSIKCMS